MRGDKKRGEFYRLRALYERQLIEEAIRLHGTHTAAAKALGLTRCYMLRLMRELQMPSRPLGWPQVTAETETERERRALAEGRAGIEVVL